MSFWTMVLDCFSPQLQSTLAYFARVLGLSLSFKHKQISQQEKENDKSMDPSWPNCKNSVYTNNSHSCP